METNEFFKAILFGAWKYLRILIYTFVILGSRESEVG